MLKNYDNGLYGHNINGSCSPPTKIAGFDLDWTLTRPTKGFFSKTFDDWKFLPNRMETLKNFIADGYTIVIFTNQLSKGKKLENTISRMENVIQKLYDNGCDVALYMSTLENKYRKPAIGMWNYCISQFNIKDVEKSFYCGDAAGRKGDFSNSDKLFAEAIGIDFYVPEEIFPNTEISVTDFQTMIILMGMPGSGKSTFYNNNLLNNGFVHVNQDILKTHSKVLSTVEKTLKEGKSVAIDETNPSIERRREYTQLASKYKVPTLILHMVRNGDEWNKLRQNPVPKIAYNIYFKKFEEPSQLLDGVPVVEIF